MLKVKSGACDMCLLDVCHQLTNSFVLFFEREKVGLRGRTVSLISELKHLCLSKGTLSFNC